MDLARAKPPMSVVKGLGKSEEGTICVLEPPTYDRKGLATISWDSHISHAVETWRVGLNIVVLSRKPAERSWHVY